MLYRVSRLVEVADISSPTPRFSLFDGNSSNRPGVLLHHCNTRYEWLVRPSSAETFTLQETPSFAWRTNGLAQWQRRDRRDSFSIIAHFWRGAAVASGRAAVRLVGSGDDAWDVGEADPLLSISFESASVPSPYPGFHPLPPRTGHEVFPHAQRSSPTTFFLELSRFLLPWLSCSRPHPSRSVQLPPFGSQA